MRIVYDAGMCDGADTAYYLHKDFRVIGIEANPIMVEFLKRRFAQELADRLLTILNVGIAERDGEMEFFVCDDVPEWSSFDLATASRNNSKYHAVRVQTLRFSRIIENHGIPYYCKIDIEGNDRLCLQGLTPSSSPRFISIEMSYRIGDMDLALLRDLGYCQFKIISQVTRAQPIGSWTRLAAMLPYRFRSLCLRFDRLIRGKTRESDWHFPPNSSGPFGEELPGQWYSYEKTVALWRQLNSIYKRTGALGEWFDIHAKLPDEQDQLKNRVAGSC
jgi:FkbM family methyltransferase